MKGAVIFTFILFASMLSYSQEISIKGRVEGVDSATVEIAYFPLKIGSSVLLKQKKVQGGNFSANLLVEDSIWHLVKISSQAFFTDRENDNARESINNLRLKNQEVMFFAAPGDDLSISIGLGKYGLRYYIHGNEINAQRNQVKFMQQPLEDKFNQLLLEAKALDSLSLEWAHKKTALALLQHQMDSLEIKSINDHPDWIYSAAMMVGLPKDTVVKYFPVLSPKIRSSFFGEYIHRWYFSELEGSFVPKLTLQDEKGRDISLSDFNGRFVVIHFWGSWCQRCLGDFSQLKDYWERNRSKFQLLSVASMDSKAAWLSSIEQLKPKWIQLLDEENEAVNLFRIEDFPNFLVIDQNGKILSQLRGSVAELFKTLDSLFEGK